MKINTYLLIFDLLLLPCCGLLAQRFTKERCMLLASFSMILLIFPIFFLLKNSSFFQAALLRSILVFIGVAFSAPLHHFVQQWIAPKHRFQAIAFSFAIGSMVIGKPTSALSIWLFQKTAFVFAPAFYVLPIAMIAFLSMHFLIKSQKEWSYEM